MELKIVRQSKTKFNEPHTVEIMPLEPEIGIRVLAVVDGAKNNKTFETQVE